MAGDGARPVVDLAALDRQTGGDQDLRRDVIDMFLEDCPGRVAAIRSAIDQSDAPALMAAAHSLKGACGYLSGVIARDAAAELEEMGRDGRVQDAAAALDRLDAAVADLIPELRKLL